MVDLDLAGLATVSNEEVASFNVTDVAGIAIVDSNSIHRLTVSEQRYGERSSWVIIEDFH
jgi:hypothetical protein